jgi:single-stranded DNA-binding protein
MNTVYLIGELVMPVEFRRDRNSGRTWGKTVIAVPRGTKGIIDFVPVTLRDREAEMAALYLGDGSLVGIDGYIHSVVQPNPIVEDVRAIRRSLRVIADRVTYLRLPRRTGTEARS